MTKDEALRLALEALEAIHTQGDVACVVTPNGEIYIKPVITAVKAALEAKDEPVAWMHIQGNYKEPSLGKLDNYEIKRGWEQYPLYTTPPQRKPLTDEEVGAIAIKSQDGISPHDDTLRFARAIEAAHGIKGEA